jgi:proteasome lid subunit RPN8/RPN11
MTLPAPERFMRDTSDHDALALNESQRAQIEREALAAYPNECCGIIFGTQGDGVRHVNLLQHVANDFETSEQFHRFSIAPKHLIDAENLASERNELVLGFYHSHPDHPANPSEFDRQHAWPFYSYVIVSVTKLSAGEMKCWQLNEQSQQFDVQELRII